MKPYFAIDIETTGLEERTSLLLEVGVVFDDLVTPRVEDLPRLHVYCDHNQIRGDVEAILMHAKSGLLEKWRDHSRHCGHTVAHKMAQFMDFHEPPIDSGHPDTDDTPVRHTIAGKNFGMFDWQFIKELGGCCEDGVLPFQIRHRVYDVGNLFCTPADDKIPDLRECLSRAGYNHEVKHGAIEDCLDVIRCMRFWAKTRA